MDRVAELKDGSPRYEIRHIGHFDVVANRTTPKQMKVDELMTLVEENLRINPDEPLAGWVTEDNCGSQGLKDRQIDPKFFAKKKWLSKEKYLGLEQTTSPLAVIKENQRFNSLLNEFSICGRVSEIVSGADFQSTIVEAGFKSVCLVEPLVGCIDRKTGNKFVIYEYVNGVDELTRPDGSLDDEFASNLVGRLKIVFAKEGIEATDMRGVQFIVGQTGSETTLFLTDIEAYRDERK